MKRETIIRAWKDPEFRANLSAEERLAVPECPAGKPFTELDEGDLEDAVGGALYLPEDGCICSDWTMPTTKPTTSLINPRINTSLQLDRSVLNVQRF